MPKYDKKQYTLPKVYKFYVERCKERNVEPVDYKTHKAILDLWGNKVVEYLTQGKDVKLHAGLASLTVRKVKQAAYTDFQASRRAGKRVQKPNVHSGFYMALVRWHRHYTKISSRGWRFVPSRRLKQSITKVMQTPGGHRTYVKKAKVTPKAHQKNSYKNHILEI